MRNDKRFCAICDHEFTPEDEVFNGFLDFICCICNEDYPNSNHAAYYERD